MNAFIYHWGGLNEWLFDRINGSHNLPIQEFWFTVSTLGYHGNAPFYFVTGVAYILCIYLYKKRQEQTIAVEDRRLWGTVLISISMGFLAVGVLTGLAKSMFAMPRPFMVIPHTEMYFLGDYPPTEKYYRSFPSGHAVTVSAMVAAFWPILNKYWRIAACIVVGVVCVSRVAIGMHFPADVAGGILMGVGGMYMVRRYVAKRIARLIR